MRSWPPIQEQAVGTTASTKRGKKAEALSFWESASFLDGYKPNSVVDVHHAN